MYVSGESVGGRTDGLDFQTFPNFSRMNETTTRSFLFIPVIIRLQ